MPALFVLRICIILTMYGGGFSTVPAYLADMFGTQMVGAIHGRLITAWSVAGVVGPRADRRYPPVRSSIAGVPHEPGLRPHALHHGRAAADRV